MTALFKNVDMKEPSAFQKFSEKIWLMSLLCTISLFSLGQATATDVTFYSNSLAMERHFQIYLPEGYNEQDSVRYPVVYFLHGATGNHSSYSELLTVYNDLIKSEEIQPCIIVKPDGSCPPWGGSWYANSELYGNFEDYIVYDLVDYIDSAYKTVPVKDKRAIMGHSMGGYGAMKLALKHPDLFCGVAAHSGWLNLKMLSQMSPAILSENGGAPVSEYRPDAGFWTHGAFAAARALSPNLANPPYFVDFPLDSMGNWIDSVWNRYSKENCTFLARSLSEEDDLAIYFDCGKQDEAFSYAQNTSFADSLDQLGIPYEFQSFTGGHSDKIATRLPIALQFLDSLMNPNAMTGMGESWQNTRMPGNITLSQNYPNPFYLSTTIPFSTQIQQRIEIRVYNLLGMQVAELANEVKPPGEYTLTFHPGNLNEGIFLIQLIAGKDIQTIKCILLIHN